MLRNSLKNRVDAILVVYFQTGERGKESWTS